jgi:hypothetical protein
MRRTHFLAAVAVGLFSAGTTLAGDPTWVLETPAFANPNRSPHSPIRQTASTSRRLTTTPFIFGIRQMVGEKWPAKVSGHLQQR